MVTWIRGFTLIELLVVIAIIGILAAVLFPVFASTKAAAKATTGVSNVRQVGLSAVLYASDADDHLPLGAYATGASFVVWHDLLMPYVKNDAIWYCPGSKVTPTDSSGTPTTDWGYNFLYLTTLKPDFSNANGHDAVSLTGVSKPASTVLFTSAHASLPNSWCGNDGKFLLPPSGKSGNCLGRPDPVLLDRVAIAWIDGHASRLLMPQFYTGQSPEDSFFAIN